MTATSSCVDCDNYNDDNNEINNQKNISELIDDQTPFEVEKKRYKGNDCFLCGICDKKLKLIVKTVISELKKGKKINEKKVLHSNVYEEDGGYPYNYKTIRFMFNSNDIEIDGIVFKYNTDGKLTEGYSEAGIFENIYEALHFKFVCNNFKSGTYISFTNRLPQDSIYYNIVPKYVLFDEKESRVIETEPSFE